MIVVVTTASEVAGHSDHVAVMLADVVVVVVVGSQVSQDGVETGTFEPIGGMKTLLCASPVVSTLGVVREVLVQVLEVMTGETVKYEEVWLEV